MGRKGVKADVRVFPGGDAMLDAAVEVVIREAAASIAGRGRFTAVLAGGSTPQGLYQRLAHAPHRDRIDWTCVHLFWGDERCVPPADAASNYRMAREALIDHVPVPPEQVHRIRGEDEPGAEAARYDALLRTALNGPGGSRAGAFDLVLLGLGTDGHTASLVPGMTAPREATSWVMAEHIDDARGWRVTLTPVPLNAARAVVFLVSGVDKAPALAAVVEGPPAPDALPAQRIATGAAAVRWLVDRAAASRLTQIAPDR